MHTRSGAVSGIVHIVVHAPHGTHSLLMLPPTIFRNAKQLLQTLTQPYFHNTARGVVGESDVIFLIWDPKS